MKIKHQRKQIIMKNQILKQNFKKLLKTSKFNETT